MKMCTNVQLPFIWGFMLENTYFTVFDTANHQIIEDAFNQRKKRPASYYITITDSHISNSFRIYFGVERIHLRMPGTRYFVERKTVRPTPPTPPPIDFVALSKFVYQNQCYGPNCWCLYMPGCCGLIQLPNNPDSNNIQNNFVQSTETTSNNFAHSSKTNSAIFDEKVAKQYPPCKYTASSSTDSNFADGYSLAGDSTASDSASCYTYSGSSVESNSLVDISLVDNNLLGNNIDSSLFNNGLDSSLLDGIMPDINFFDVNYFDISSFAGNTFIADSLTDPNFVNHILTNNLTTWNPVVPSQDLTNLGYQGFQTYQC
jgi:hypothetical protein